MASDNTASSTNHTHFLGRIDLVHHEYEDDIEDDYWYWQLSDGRTSPKYSSKIYATEAMEHLTANDFE